MTTDFNVSKISRVKVPRWCTILWFLCASIRQIWGLRSRWNRRAYKVSQRLLIEGADSQVEQRNMPTSIESSGQRDCVDECRRGHSHNANETS